MEQKEKGYKEKGYKEKKQKREEYKGKRYKEKGYKEKEQKERVPKEKEKREKGQKENLCPYFKKCGSCKYLNVTYHKQLKIKQHTVEKLIGTYCKVQPIKGMKEPYHYRNKVHAVFDRDRHGNILSGVYKEGTHQVVSIDSCLLEDEKADQIIVTIRGMLKSFKIKTYDEDSGYGLLRHVLVRRGFATGQIMVVLVTSSPIFPSKKNFVKALLKEHPEITTIVQNINSKNTSMVLDVKEQVLYGKGYIEDILCGLTFRISSRSFYQVNPVQTEYLYKKALKLAGLTGKETVIDAYCGIGTIGMAAAKHAGHVIGVELNKDAVRDAVLNARNNHIENIDFYCNDAGKFMEEYLACETEKRKKEKRSEGKKERKGSRESKDKEEKSLVDLVFLDPPRSGSSEKFLDSLALLQPKKIVYISCNPETLARDLEYLKKKGYQALECYPVDMFCWTEHVECVVLMSRVEK